MISSNEGRSARRFHPAVALFKGSLGAVSHAWLACSLLLAALPVAGAPIEVRVASAAPDGTPWSEHFRGMASRMEKASGGRLAFKIYMGSQLGGEVETLRSLQRGRIQAWGGSIGALASLVPELNLTELPYLFHSVEEADYIFDEVLFKPYAELLAQKGLVLQSWNENGWRHIATRSRAILAPADVKGLKMRSQPSAQHLRMWKLLGANPVAISAPEVLTSLQTGVVDAFDNSPVITVSASWHTAARHFSLTQHIYQGAAVIYNKAWFDKQPEDIRAILLGDARAEARTARAGVRAMIPEVLQLMEKEGVQVHRLDSAQLQAFSQVLAPLHDEFAKGENAELLARTRAALADFRLRRKTAANPSAPASPPSPRPSPSPAAPAR